MQMIFPKWYVGRCAAIFSFAVAAALVLTSTLAVAEGLGSEIRIDDANPESSVPSQEELAKAGPLQFAYLLMELSERADKAEKANDHSAAVKYFRALAKLVPERATAFSKLCELYQKVGDRNGAVAACRIATGLEGVKVSDYLRYVQLLMATPEGVALSPGDVAELDAVFQHLEAQNQEGLEIQVAKCQLGVKLEDTARLQQCVQRLQRVLPEGDPIILPYQWSLALHEKNFALAAWARRASARGRPQSRSNQDDGGGNSGSSTGRSCRLDTTVESGAVGPRSASHCRGRDRVDAVVVAPAPAHACRVGHGTFSSVAVRNDTNASMNRHKGLRYSG